MMQETYDPQCETCGYNLTGLNDDGSHIGNCPECGAWYDLLVIKDAKRRSLRKADRRLTQYLLASALAGPVITSSAWLGLAFAVAGVYIVILFIMAVRAARVMASIDVRSRKKETTFHWAIAFLISLVLASLFGLIIFSASLMIFAPILMAITG